MNVETFTLLARYNHWASKRLNVILSEVSDEHFFQDSGLFFSSIFGTLNHMLVGEHYLWYPRFAHHESPIMSLNSILIEDRAILLKEMQTKSLNWLPFVEKLDPALLEQQLHYKTSSGQGMSLPYAATLLHVFNHGTHHRGQISSALTQLGYTCPEMDLVYMLIDER